MTHISIYTYVRMSILVCIYSYTRIVYTHITRIFWFAYLWAVLYTLYFVVMNYLVLQLKEIVMSIHKVVLLEKSGVLKNSLNSFRSFPDYVDTLSPTDPWFVWTFKVKMYRWSASLYDSCSRVLCSIDYCQAQSPQLIKKIHQPHAIW